MKTLAFLTALLIASSSGQFSAEELTGDWVSDCTPLPERHSVSATLSFSETAVTAVVEMFSDNSCQSLNLRGEYDALFSVGRRVAAGREIDFTPTRVTMTILKPEVVAAYRQNAPVRLPRNRRPRRRTRCFLMILGSEERNSWCAATTKTPGSSSRRLS